MNIERLKLMTEMLDEVKAGKWKPSEVIPRSQRRKDGAHNRTFNLGCWVVVGATVSGNRCGFAACAVGHACLDKRFTEQGLEFNWDHSLTVPEFGEEGGVQAVANFFEITTDRAREFFYPSRYMQGTHTTAGQVSNRIKEFIAKSLKPAKQAK